MITAEYSSGLVSESFWFFEFKEYLKLKSKDKSDSEIRTEIVDGNLFGAPNTNRAKRVYGYLTRRVVTLDSKAIDLFFNSDLSTQKLINLICIMRTSRIFFEFINEVYREKVILGSEYIEASDIRIFLKNKAVQSDDVAKWTEPTQKRITGSFLTMLTEANLLTETNNARRITPPIVDILLENYLKANGEADIIKAMTGAN